MSANESFRAERLLACIGEIDESILEEAESADIASATAARKRVVKYGALAAAASIGIAAACWFLRTRRMAASA